MIKDILRAEFKITNAGDTIEDNEYELTYSLDEFDINGPTKMTKMITRKQYEFIQYHLKNIIGE